MLYPTKENYLLKCYPFIATLKCNYVYTFIFDKIHNFLFDLVTLEICKKCSLDREILTFEFNIYEFNTLL